MKTRKLILPSMLMVCVVSTLLLSACGGDPNAVNPLPVADAGPDAAADAAHDGGDAATKVEDGGTD